MKPAAVVILAVLACLPVSAQDQSSCKAFFQIVRADSGMPGVRSGMDSAQKKWWNAHQKKYPGLCFSGGVTSGDKPRYLVIWSKSKRVGQTAQGPAGVFGQTASALQAAAPMTAIYQKRWDLAAVTIINVEGDGSLLLPPVYFEADDREIGALTGAGPLNAWHPGSAKVLKAAVEYLFEERAFLPNSK